MTKSTKLFKTFLLVVTLGLILSVFGVMNNKNVGAKEIADLKDAVTMSDTDFNTNALLIETTSKLVDENEKGGGFKTFYTNRPLVDGSNGLVLRIKNCSSNAFTTKIQFNMLKSSGKMDGLVTVNGTPYTLISKDGTVTSYTAQTNRYYTFPANFDGILVVDFASLARFKYEGTTTWGNATASNYISASGTEWTSPVTGSVFTVDFYVAKASYHSQVNPILLGTVRSYTLGESISLGASNYFYTNDTNLATDYLTFTKHTAFEGNIIVGDSGITPSKTKVYYGDVITLSGVAADAQFVSVGSYKFTKSGENWVGGPFYTNPGNAEIKVTKTINGVQKALTFDAFDSNDFLINGSALTAETPYSTLNTSQGVLLAKNQISLAGTDGIAIRIRNFDSATYYVARIFIRATGNYVYMLDSSTAANFTFIDKNGSVEKSNKNRGFDVPGNFDGWVVFDWSDVCFLYKGTTTADWTGNVHPVKGTNYPSTNLEGIQFTFNNRSNSIEEIAIGDIATFTTADDVRTFTVYENLLDVDTNTLATSTLKVSAYPAFASAITCTNTYVSLNKTTVSYRDTLIVSPKNDLYVISSAKLDGVDLTPVGDGTYKITVTKACSTLVVEGAEIPSTVNKELTGEKVTTGKTGILFDVNNTSEYPIQYQLIFSDASSNAYVAKQGAGMFIKDGVSKYWADVFTIPAGFVGKVFIPFNYAEVANYAPAINTPFDKTQPAEFASQVVVKFVPNANVDVTLVGQVFSNFTLTSESYKVDDPVKAALDTTVASGKTILMTSTYNNFGSGCGVILTAKTGVSMDVQGFGFYFENNSAKDITLRIYAYSNSGKVFVPDNTFNYWLVDAQGNASQKVSKQRNLTIPAGFKGTLVLGIPQYRTDKKEAAKGTDICNISFEKDTFKEFRFYMAGDKDGSLAMSNDLLIAKHDGTTEKVEGFITAFAAIQKQATTNDAKTPVLVENTVVTPTIKTKVDNVEYTGEALYTMNKASFLKVDKIVVNVDPDQYTITSIKIGDKAFSKVSKGQYQLYVTDLASTDEIVIELSSHVYYEVELEFDSTKLAPKVDGNAYTSKLSIEKGSNIVISADDLNGYELDYIEVNGVRADSLTVAISKDTKIKVLFVATEYSITYNLNGGTNAETNPAVYTEIEVPTLAAPTKAEYTFKGWFTDEALTQAFTGLTKGDVVLYAKWEIVKYNFTAQFVASEATVSVNGSSSITGLKFAKGESVVVAVAPKTGYQVSAVKVNNVAVTNYTITIDGETTVVVEMSKVEYTITYHLDGGENNSTNPARYTVTDSGVLLDATKEGYTFEGWFTDEAFENAIARIQVGSTGNLDLYAKFVKIEEEPVAPAKGGCTLSISALSISLVSSLCALAFCALKRKEN